nr:reverse transcriptase domain-containing protein [Tanacetum cinerariifolium]
PRKLGDPRKFLIPCEFSGMDECLALADLGANIKLMPLSVWEGLSLPELTPTCMTLKLADRSVSKPIGIAKDVSFKVGIFHFPADFVVVDFEPDPRVPLILGRCFLKTSRALIDVHKGELTLRIGNEAITYNLDQTVRYSANYNQMTTNKMDVVESACEEYSQEVLSFSNVTASGTPTPQNDPIVSATSPTPTPFGDSDFLLFEEDDAFLGLENDPDLPKINPFYYDPEGDILLLEAILNSKPSPPLPNQEQNLPSFKEELKGYEAQTVKSSIDEPLEVELKDLPHHLEYAFLEGDNKLPVIIAKELRSEEKAALIKVLKSHKRAIAWKLSDIQATLWSKRALSSAIRFPKTGLRSTEPKSMSLLNYLIPQPSRVFEVFSVTPVFTGDSFQDFSKISRPMTHLLEKNTPFVFSEDCIQAFQTLKKTLTEAPILIAPNWDLPFELMCDASDFAIGAVLGQRHEKHFKPLHYASKMMNDAETNYTTTEKKMLAVVYAFETFRSYLIMNKSIVHTDHSALKYLFAKKDAKARLLRWVLLLQEFDFKKELKVCEAKTVKSSVDKPPEVELKDLPPHLEYAFLEGDNKLAVIIAKELGDEEKSALIKILMEEYYKPAVQHQRRVNLKIHDVIKKEVEKLLDAGLIYPISDSPWVCLVHCVPKKGGFTVVKNEENELISTRLVTRWRVCIDYQKLNEATRKDHFPLPFMDQMLKRLAGNEYYCFLDGFPRYFQIPIDPRDQEKTTFTCPYETFAIDTCLSVCAMHRERFKDTNLCLNWEKSHFMVKEGIVLGHKISKNEIEVDRAKVDVIAKLPHPTTVK